MIPPTVLSAVLLATGSTSSSSKTTTTGSPLGFYLLLAVGALAVYFLFMRPRSRQVQAQRALLQELGPGDEVLTSAGIFGTVLDVMDDRVTIETAPGTRITVVRSSIARRTPPGGADGSGVTVGDLQRSYDHDDADEHDDDTHGHGEGEDDGEYDEGQYDEGDDDGESAEHDPGGGRR